jgi:thiamine transport system substrate-binding protein
MQRKKIMPKFIILFLLAAIVVLASCQKGRSNQEQNLVIWTYDSFTSDWGPGPDVSRIFEEKTGIKITWVSHGDAGSVVSRLLMEGEKAKADIILGLDQNLADRVTESKLLEPYKPASAENILPELILDSDFRLIPMDYSFFAIVYDSDVVTNPPASLNDLTNPRFAKSLILIDPRTSSPGLGFFGWVKEVYKNDWQNYWRRLQPSILTITEGWSSAYGLFTRGEAPMVLSYTTSPGYHLEYEETERYKAAIFSDGHSMQIEAAALLKNADNKKNAKIFLDFMISPDFQNIIPLTNWMFPVIDIPLPDSFRIAPKSNKPIMNSPVTEAELNEWAALMIR